MTKSINLNRQTRLTSSPIISPFDHGSFLLLVDFIEREREKDTRLISEQQELLFTSLIKEQFLSLVRTYLVSRCRFSFHNYNFWLQAPFYPKNLLLQTHKERFSWSNQIREKHLGIIRTIQTESGH